MLIPGRLTAIHNVSNRLGELFHHILLFIIFLRFLINLKSLDSAAHRLTRSVQRHNADSGSVTDFSEKPRGQPVYARTATLRLSETRYTGCPAFCFIKQSSFSIPSAPLTATKPGSRITGTLQNTIQTARSILTSLFIYSFSFRAALLLHTAIFRNMHPGITPTRSVILY